ncbi:MAG: fibronectin type III domain-containing protein [Acidobacteriaceae bacterium]
MKITPRFVLAAALAFSLSAVAPGQNRPQPERITNGPVIERTGSSWAVIAWTTDTGGSSVVHYGPDRNRLSKTAEAPYSDNEKTQGQNHRVRINNLQPGTTYYYRVDSGHGEGTGTQAESPILSFSTSGGNPSAQNSGAGQSARSGSLAIINGPVVESARENSAVIAWTTNTGGSTLVLL